MRFRLAVFVLLALSDAGARQVIPIHLVNNAVLVPVQLNGHSLSFLLDTGSEKTVVDPEVVASLGLKATSEVGILKNYRAQASGAVGSARISIGKLSFDRTLLAVVSLSAVSRALGTAVDGVLGNDILENFDFALNYSRQQLALGPFPAIENAGVPITLRRSVHEFYIPLQIESLPVDLLLDTGTNSTNLSWHTWQRLSSVWTPSEIIDGVARAGFPAPPAFMVCLPAVRLGNISLAHQAVRVQRAVGSGVFSADDFGGILGSELLRQFEVTFDLKHDRIFLKRDNQFRPDPNRYVTVGIQFAPNRQGSYSVMSVWKNSPADEAGIRLGDQISAVNGEAASSLSAEQLSAKLHGDEGTAVNLTVGRNGLASAVTLHTRQMLCGGRGEHEQLRTRK